MARAGHSVTAARQAMLECIAPLGSESVPLELAAGRTLAEPVIAARAQPPLRSSAMDGYGVRSADSPSEAFIVAGEAAAGRPYVGPRLGARGAVRIFTGAPVPDGVDRVVPQERARREGDAVWLEAPEPSRTNIREAGVDFVAGAVLAARGVRLSARRLGLIAASGAPAVRVTQRPRVALLATGDEIVPPGTPAAPHQIYDSVSFALGASIAEWGGEALRLTGRPDAPAAIAAASGEGLERTDLLVIIGGASVGDYDIVKSSLGGLGLSLIVERVAVRPGKPTWFGTAAGKPVLGLPGNPAAALVCAHLFLKPLLHAMLAQDPCHGSSTARLQAALPASGPDEWYLRSVSRAGEDAVLRTRPCDDQDTSLLSVFAAANTLIRRPAESSAAERDALVEVLWL
ncbi:MAG TPA: gephyrin-like molybdotransferase Glp [Steroidobacteraceae bacterium]|nr:gephyrin-like molybdotransferase Glp [Steroidobacteraceae bacterium]